MGDFKSDVFWSEKKVHVIPVSVLSHVPKGSSVVRLSFSEDPLKFNL